MALVSLQNIGIGFAEPLLDDISLQIEEGEHICLLGRNGSGKTTLMKLISGELSPDRGLVVRRQGMGTARLTQEIPEQMNRTVWDLVGSAGADYGHMIESHRLERILHELKLTGNDQFDTLSSGLKRRALLARALLAEPDLLMLDEPTNHLDIESIAWLDGYLRDYPKAVLLVTHDRQLVRSVAGRIIEIDLGRLFDWKCSYDLFLQRKEDALAAEEQQNKRFDKKLSQEEVWIRQGIKARRTRNEGRVKALLAMREERRNRRGAVGQVKMILQEGNRSGELVLKARKLGYRYERKALFSGFSTVVNRRDRIGIMGPNGCGKSTLIRLLLGELTPTEGEVELGTGLRIIYYDQQRQQLDDEKTVWENLAGGNDHVLINGRSEHVVGYLQRFLFSPERLHVAVRCLSGGERGRLLLARLFTQPCNLLVLDEPTNDLDIETLELLEEILLDYQGTLLLISHDRAFINNVVTSTLVFEAGNGIAEYVGGYDDWLRQRPVPAKTAEPEKSPPSQRVKVAQKLTNKEERELASLPGEIENLEAEKKSLLDSMSKPDFYRREPDEITRANSQLQSLETAIGQAYHRWQVLEDKRLEFSAKS
jgi:ATP-binding cassette subfamily F protein uup